MFVSRSGIKISQHAGNQIQSCTARLIRAPLRVGPFISQNRTLTNATKNDYVGALQNVKSSIVKPGGWQPTLIHSSGEVKFTVIRVKPGGEVPSHYHSESWDYFVPLSGHGLIETRAENGEMKDFTMEAQDFLAVPPKEVHRVRNNSDDEEFVFLIAQSPRAKYDFVDPE